MNQEEFAVMRKQMLKKIERKEKILAIIAWTIILAFAITAIMIVINLQLGYTGWALFVAALIVIIICLTILWAIKTVMDF